MASSSTAIPDPPPTPSPGDLPPIPPSPSYSYASTANPISNLNLPLPPPPPTQSYPILSKNDLLKSQEAYTELLTTAKAYRQALSTLSTTASAFGTALEACARLKEARSPPLYNPSSLSNSYRTGGPCTADSLMTTSGVHHLVANHQLILSETVYRSFEVPLLHELDGWRRKIEDEDASYQKEIKARTREIRRMEKEGIKLQKERRRDIGRLRSHLVQLTLMLDGMTGVHQQHSRTLLMSSQETSSKIVDASSVLVRAEVEIYENLARKGWTGGGLDDLLEHSVDPFSEAETNGPGEMNGSREIFSILPTKSILPTNNDVGSPPIGHSRLPSMGGFGTGGGYQSLTGALSDYGGEEDVRSIFSAHGIDSALHGKGIRPFSPPPGNRIRREEGNEAPSRGRSLGREDTHGLVQSPPTEEVPDYTIGAVGIPSITAGEAEEERLASEREDGEKVARVSDEDRGREIHQPLVKRERRWSVSDDVMSVSSQNGGTVMANAF